MTDPTPRPGPDAQDNDARDLYELRSAEPGSVFVALLAAVLGVAAILAVFALITWARYTTS